MVQLALRRRWISQLTFHCRYCYFKYIVDFNPNSSLGLRPWAIVFGTIGTSCAQNHNNGLYRPEAHVACRDVLPGAQVVPQGSGCVPDLYDCNTRNEATGAPLYCDVQSPYVDESTYRDWPGTCKGEALASCGSNADCGFNAPVCTMA